MKPSYKTFALKLDDADEQSGIIKGFASTFGNIDLGDDVVEKGAFKKTLKETKGIVPILDHHMPHLQIGWNELAEEQEKGLYVEGRLNLETQGGREKFALAKQAVKLGAKTGLSIGYYPIKAEPDKERPMVRRLKELKLIEYSLVTFPMNTMAMVTAAKAFNMDSEMTPEHLVEAFFEQAKTLGFNPGAIKQALHKGAATHLIDPARVGQSIDRLIDLLKQK